jgi:hypothetical protein
MSLKMQFAAIKVRELATHEQALPLEKVGKTHGTVENVYNVNFYRTFALESAYE